MNEQNRGIAESPPLRAAIEELQKAEAHLKDAQKDEALAEREVAEAIEEIKEVEAERTHVTVHVVHVNEVEKAHFKEKLTATLQQVWDTSYVKLEIPRKPKDVFQTGGEHPKSLMASFWAVDRRTAARQQKVIEDFHWHCFGNRRRAIMRRANASTMTLAKPVRSRMISHVSCGC